MVMIPVVEYVSSIRDADANNGFIDAYEIQKACQKNKTYKLLNSERTFFVPVFNARQINNKENIKI